MAKNKKFEILVWHAPTQFLVQMKGRYSTGGTKPPVFEPPSVREFKNGFQVEPNGKGHSNPKGGKMVKFNVSKIDDLGVKIEFEIEGGVLTPGELPRVVEEFEKVIQSHFEGGVVVSGRGPVWLYAALIHAAHPARWTGTYEPRSGGSIVVSRHHETAPALGVVVPC